MENKYLEVFSELHNQLLNYPRNTLRDKYLEIIVQEQLKQFKYSDDGFEPEKLSRQQIYARAKSINENTVDSLTAKNAVQTSKLKSTLSEFIQWQPDCKRAFINLGYKPTIVSSASGGGSKNKTLIWMDIEAIDSADEGNEQTDGSTVLDSDDEDPEDLSSITYERKATSDVKPSLFTRLFFKQGELKMMSFKGIVLMLLLLLSFFLDILIAIYAVFVVMLMNEIPNLKLWQAFLYAILIPVAYLNWRYFFMPLSAPIRRFYLPAWSSAAGIDGGRQYRTAVISSRPVAASPSAADRTAAPPFGDQPSPSFSGNEMRMPSRLSGAMFQLCAFA